MSRSDRIVNILLALAWVLLIVRVGRIYFESTTGAPAQSFDLDEPIPSPIVLVRCFSPLATAYCLPTPLLVCFFCVAQLAIDDSPYFPQTARA